MQAGKRAVTRVLAVIAPIAALLVASCEVGPDYKTPKDHAPAQFNEIESATRPITPSSTQPISADMQPDDYQRWWNNFNDPILNSLIDRAAKGNLDLVAAEARIREARAQRGIVTSGLFPQASADGSYSRAAPAPTLSPAAVAKGSFPASPVISGRRDLMPPGKSTYSAAPVAASKPPITTSRLLSKISAMSWSP